MCSPWGDQSPQFLRGRSRLTYEAPTKLDGSGFYGETGDYRHYADLADPRWQEREQWAEQAQDEALLEHDPAYFAGAWRGTDGADERF